MVCVAATDAGEGKTAVRGSQHRPQEATLAAGLADGKFAFRSAWYNARKNWKIGAQHETTHTAARSRQTNDKTVYIPNVFIVCSGANSSVRNWY